MEELKPCPFCGSKAELYGECDMVWVRCSNDNCRAELITRFDEPEDAIKEWNQRALYLVPCNECYFADNEQGEGCLTCDCVESPHHGYDVEDCEVQCQFFKRYRN